MKVDTSFVNKKMVEMKGYWVKSICKEDLC